MKHHNKSKNILKKATHIVIFLSITLSNHLLFTQNFKLKLLAIDSIENSILNKKEFLTEHKTEKELSNEINFVSFKLKKDGFFLNTIDSVVKKEIYTTAYISLNRKYQKIIIRNNQKKDSITISNIESYLIQKTNEFEKEGKLFSQISLVNIRSVEDVLFADLKISQSQTRTVNKLVVKGYQKLPKNYLIHLLKLKNKKTLNKQRLEETSSILKSLPFISQTKEPETLFTKDSTLLYIYLKEKKSNNFEGLINFGPSTDNKGIIFTGYLNLQLNNVFHKGEQLGLEWRANGNESQNFTLQNKLPYIFNTPITSELNLNIHKQDSSFLNSSFSARLLYDVNSKTKIGVTYNSESSTNILSNTNDSIKSFNNNFYGGYLEIRSLIKNNFNENKFSLVLNPSFGTRNTSESKSNQLMLKLNTSYILNINNRNSILSKINLGYLHSKTPLLTNELFRIGGYENLRGIEQESFFTNKYFIFNSEYRFKTSTDSFLYSVTDLAELNNSLNLKETLYSLGIGYKFKTNSSIIDINYTTNNNINTSFSLSKSKFNITFLNFF